MTIENTVSIEFDLCSLIVKSDFDCCLPFDINVNIYTSVKFPHSKLLKKSESASANLKSYRYMYQRSK